MECMKCMPSATVAAAGSVWRTRIQATFVVCTERHRSSSTVRPVCLHALRPSYTSKPQAFAQSFAIAVSTCLQCASAQPLESDSQC